MYKDPYNDPYDTGIPKYSTAQDIYDALCELAQGKEMGILSEMFTDVSWENQDYYYVSNGLELKEKFEEMTNWCNNMWILDLAICQIDESEIHDLVWECLINSDAAKRVGFKKIFVEKMLHGDASLYNEIIEEYYEATSDLNRFTFWEMTKAYNKVIEARGLQYDHYAYQNFCHSFTEKIRNLKLEKETRLIIECRALLTAYDDFLFGLRANQHLYNRLDALYIDRKKELEDAYNEKIKQLLLIAEKQGIALSLEDSTKLLQGETNSEEVIPALSHEWAALKNS